VSPWPGVRYIRWGDIFIFVYYIERHIYNYIYIVCVCIYIFIHVYTHIKHPLELSIATTWGYTKFSDKSRRSGT